MTYQSQAEYSATINHQLKKVLKQQRQNASTINPAYAQLWQTLEDLMLSGGKRLRPYMTYLAYMSNEGPDESSIHQVAAAQEFLHFALLIHDDIIDRDTVRYGRQNIIGVYTDIYRQANQDAQHYANGAALMAGDLALSQAYELISKSTFPDKQKIQASNILGQSLFHVAGGELLDMEAAIPGIDHTDYFTIARHKTAYYSFVGPLLTGATLAEASEDTQQHLRHFGLNLGIAYQLADDLLGLYGDQEATGKPIISDLREGKKTFLFELIQQLSPESNLEYFRKTWGNPNVTIADVKRVRKIGQSTSAKDQVEQRMKEFADRAQQSLDKIQLPKPHLQPFYQLLSKAINREY